MDFADDTQPLEDLHLGEDPTVREEQEFLADKAEAFAKDQQSSFLERELAELRAELKRTNDLVKKMAAEGHGVDRIGAVAIEDVRRQEREDLYHALMSTGDGQVTIQIHTHEDPARNTPVHVCVNGQVWNIKRGKPIRVPVCVMAVLDNCRVQHFAPEVDANGNRVMVEHDYLHYPYTMLDAYATKLIAEAAA